MGARPAIARALAEAGGPCTLGELRARLGPGVSRRALFRVLADDPRIERIGPGAYQLASLDVVVLPARVSLTVLGELVALWMARCPAGASLRWARTAAGSVFTLSEPAPEPARYR